MNETMNRLQHEGREIFRFGFGQSPFPVPDILVKALRQFADKKEYLPVQGLAALRQAIASFYSTRLNVPVESDQVVIGPGTKELIWSAILTFPGEILLPSPSWVSYAPQAYMAQKNITWIDSKPENNWIINAKEFEAACSSTDSSKLIILNYPNNPTGTIPTESQMHEIIDVARRYNVIIIHDNIYGMLDHSGSDRMVFPAYPDQTILSDGLSKWCGAGGWRLGFHIFPKSLRNFQAAVLSMASETFSCVAAPIQYAATSAFQGHAALDDYVRQCRKALALISEYTYRMLSNSRLYVCPSQGGFYFFPIFNEYRKALEARGIASNKTLCEYILAETGVALLPGLVFGRPNNELSARLAYVDFDGAKVLHRFTQDNTPISDTEEFVSEYCPRLKSGLIRLIDWLNQLQ